MRDIEQALAAMTAEELRRFAMQFVFAIEQQRDLEDARAVIEEWLDEK